MTRTPAVIPTSYAGCRFRSRLEARWAVFLDHLDISWQYEPEGYRLPSGPYLPDFLIHPGTPYAFWLEIKPVLSVTDREGRLLAELAEATGLWAFMYCRFPEAPVPLSTRWGEEYGKNFYLDSRMMELVEDPDPSWPFWNSGLRETGFWSHPAHGGTPVPKPEDLWWTDCPYCGKVMITLQGCVVGCPAYTAKVGDRELDGAELREHGTTLGGRSAIDRVTTPRLLTAYAAARSARFEHGESGA